ncbi:hypothetical protein QYE76_018788, partial [Lolium multiflorum]
IAMDEVRKKLFSISLSRKAAHWYKLLDDGDSLEWNDIVPRFYSKFYSPSEIHKDRNLIYNFWPHDGESIAQAWGRLKSLMLKCPIHELPGNIIIDNFYARLSFQDKTLLDTSCSGSFTRNKEEFKRDLLNRIQENTEGWENNKDRESGINYDYKCIEAFMDTDKFRNMSATYGLDSQVAANLYKAFASHYELPKKNFDKFHEPYKDKIDPSINKCVVVETVDHVIPEAYIEKTPFLAKMKEYSIINSAVNKSEKKPIEPEEQIKVQPAIAIVKDLVTENVEDGHIILCEDASNIVSHPNKSRKASVPMLSVRIGDHCYYGLCDIGASISAIPCELYTEIMHEIGSCELEDIDVVIRLANRETISPIGIVRDTGINRVLQSLPPSYKNFVMNYNMQNMNKELPELFGMLKAAEIEIKKEHQVLMVNKTTSFKKQGKSKGKFKKGGKKAATPPMKPKNGPKPDAECYYCKEKGHWKRNCSKYLADLKSGLVKKKKEVTMRVGNGSKVNVIAVGTLPLHLPSGLVLSLNNCYYVPALSMNIISGSCLMQDVKRMKKLHTDGLLESLDFESLDRCEACLMGKMTKTPFSGMMERATDLLEIIHTDVCGPMSVASRGGYRYVLTFTDDLSRYGYIYFMKHKSETFEKFKEFQSEVENQRNKKIKFLRSDRGGEYLSYEFGMHLKKCGILSQLTPPGTPQRNGVSERRNRTLLDMTAAFTLNRAPSKSVETTPYELWFNKKPKLSFLKVWGCEAYVKKLQPDKLEPKAEKCVFIGYPKETIGYTFYHRSEGKIFVAKNGTFLEKEFLTKEVTGRKVELDEIDESILVDQSSAVPEVVPVPPTPATEEANDNDHETSNEETTEPHNNDEDPATYEEAMMSPIPTNGKKP